MTIAPELKAKSHHGFIGLRRVRVAIVIKVKERVKALLAVQTIGMRQDPLRL